MRGISLEQVVQSINENLPPMQNLTPTPGQASVCALTEFNERVVVGDLWPRSELAPRDRSLVTISSLVAQGQLEQLSDQLAKGLGNGLSEKEISESITHLAFYVGWPKATTALQVAEATIRRLDSI